MGARKHRREFIVEVAWEINPNPTPYELEKWRNVWAILFKTTSTDKSEKPEVSRAISLTSSEFSNIISSTTFRCACCGQTWSVKYLPDAKWTPEWWKCPNECYKSE